MALDTVCIYRKLERRFYGILTKVDEQTEKRRVALQVPPDSKLKLFKLNLEKKIFRCDFGLPIFFAL